MCATSTSTINIFVSYSHEDERWVRDGQYGIVPWLSRQLKRSGVEFWLDHTLQQLPGEDYKHKI